jgi:hypothetical protein
VGGDPAILAKVRVEMTHELMAVEIEVHPVRITASLGTSKDISIESPRFRDIADLQGDMKWRKHRQLPSSPSSHRVIMPHLQSSEFPAPK